MQRRRAILFAKMTAGFFALLVLIVAAAWLHDRSVRGRLLADLPPAGRYVETARAHLHYLIANPDKKPGQPTFVLIHGSSANAHDMMLALGDVLSPHGTVLSFDRPGIGRSRNKVSDRAMSDPREQASEIHAAVKQLGHDNIIVVGQSWGGSTAFGYAQRHGEEIAGTVMLAPPIIPWYGPDFWAYRLVTVPVIGPVFAHAVLGKYGRTQLQAGADASAYPTTAPEGYVRDAAIALILQPRAFITNAVYAMGLKHHLADMQQHFDNMPGTQEKLMIIHGNRDRTVSIKWNALPFFAARPDVELIELKGAGHLLHHTHRSEIGEAVMRLVRDGKVRPGHHIIPEKTAGKEG